LDKILAHRGSIPHQVIEKVCLTELNVKFSSIEVGTEVAFTQTRNEVQMFKISRSLNPIKIGSWITTAILIFACSKKDADNAVTKVSNSVAKSLDRCEGYNTENVPDAESVVVRDVAPDYEIHLYWLGRSNKLNFWTDHGIPNEYYNLEFNPPAFSDLKQVAEGKEQVQDSRTNCTENKVKAFECIHRLDTLRGYIKSARESYSRQKIDLSKSEFRGKSMTFTCADEKALAISNDLKRMFP
jgi:hypothetical protein